jgi:DNA-binding transcriptional LysR family regulator
VVDLDKLDTVNMSTVAEAATWQLVGPDGATHALQHRPRYVADDLMTLKFAVLGGTGMCILPDYLCSEELRDGRLVNVLPGWAPKPGVFHAVFPSRRGLVPAVRRFLDFLGETIEREGLAQAPTTAPTALQYPQPCFSAYP